MGVFHAGIESACTGWRREQYALPKLSLSDLRANVGKHQVSASEIDDKFKHNTAWVLERARPLRQPVPFHFPLGAVIWVNLDATATAIVEQRLVVG
jgi:hypothetical protein